MARRIISLQVVQAHTTSGGGGSYVTQHKAQLIALADDGTVWECTRDPSGGYSSWTRLHDLPEDADGEGL